MNITSNQKPHEISQASTSSNFRQGDLDSLEAKIDLKLIQLHFKIQNKVTEEFTSSFENLLKTSLSLIEVTNVVEAHAFVHVSVPIPSHKTQGTMVPMELTECAGTIEDLDLIQDAANNPAAGNNSREMQRLIIKCGKRLWPSNSPLIHN